MDRRDRESPFPRNHRSSQIENDYGRFPGRIDERSGEGNSNLGLLAAPSVPGNLAETDHVPLKI